MAAADCNIRFDSGRFGEPMRKLAAAFVLALVIALMLLGGALLCHGAVTRYRPNSLGVLIPMDNPNTSTVGEIVSGEEHVDGDGRIGVNLRIHPLATYRLFDTSVMFCGDESLDQLTIQDGDKYYFVMGYYVFTYKRVSARLIDGVPCHDLLGVNKVILPPGTTPQTP
jgi:hypothetical protein